MQEHVCSICGNKYVLGENTFPECSECIKKKMKNQGKKPKHENVTNALACSGYASFMNSGFNPMSVFEYIAGGTPPEATGCCCFYDTKHKSYVAISHKPLGEIQGSGWNASSTTISAPYAGLVNYQRDGHWNFFTPDQVRNNMDSGRWLILPKCSCCGETQVYKEGDICLNCKNT